MRTADGRGKPVPAAGRGRGDCGAPYRFASTRFPPPCPPGDAGRGHRSGQEALALPAGAPRTWAVDCKNVGRGEKALLYLGRYLYRGVLQEKDILACENGQVTFRYRHAKRKRFAYRILPGVQFLALVLQHVLPKDFRRARNFGFLHPNSKRAIALLQWLFGLDPKRLIAKLGPRPRLTCPCCGADMIILHTCLPPRAARAPTVRRLEASAAAVM